MAPHIEIITTSLDAHKKKRVQRLTRAIKANLKPEKAHIVLEEIDRAIKSSEVIFEKNLKETYQGYENRVAAAKASQVETLRKISELSAKALNATHKNIDHFMKGVEKITTSSTCNIERGDQLASIIEMERLRKNNYGQKMEEKYQQLMQDLQPVFKTIHELEQVFNKKAHLLLSAYKKELGKVVKHILSKHIPRSQHLVVAI